MFVITKSMKSDTSYLPIPMAKLIAYVSDGFTAVTKNENVDICVTSMYAGIDEPILMAVSAYRVSSMLGALVGNM